MDRLEFIEDIDIESLSYNSERDYLVYLGWKYRNVPIGTTWMVDNETNAKVIVAGHFKKNTQLFNIASILNYNDSYGYRVLVDDTAIMVYPTNVYGGIDYYLYTVENGYTLEEAMSVVATQFAENGMEIHQYSLKNHEKDMFRGLLEIKERLGELIPIVIVVCSILFILLQILIAVKRTSLYGIYRMVGFGKKTIFVTNLIEQGIKTSIAYIFSITAIKWLMQMVVGIDSSTVMNEIWKVLQNRVCGRVLLLAILLWGISTIVPFLLHERVNISKLIKGDWR